MNYSDNPFERISTGQEIKDWIWYNAHKKTKYTSLAKRMMSFFNLSDEKKYILTLQNDIPQIAEAEGGQMNALSCNNKIIC